jgi:phosphate transport system substrate-binding protein
MPEPTPTTTPPPAADTPSPTVVPTEPPQWLVLADYLRDNFPIIDGSSSTIPLDAAIRAEIFNIDADEALKQVRHTTTYGSFDRILLDYMDYTSYDPADVLLSVAYYPESLDMAKELGADLVITPVAKEAFVFLVNASNPVDSISQDNLRLIYSGQITNWNQLGGDDAPIKAFQRNRESGSQTAMVDFMGGAELTVAETELSPGAMSGLVNAIADFDEGQYAIGYSVYSFAAKQYANSSNVKLVKVDGITPSDGSIGNNTYPLVNYTYTYYDNNNAVSAEKAKALTDWLLTPEGQKFVARSGYVNLDGERALDDKQVSLFGASGTGSDPAEGELPGSYYSLLFSKVYQGYENDNELIISYETENVTKLTFENEYYQDSVPAATGMYPVITGMKLADAQEKINDEIRVMVEALEIEAQSFIDMVGMDIILAHNFIDEDENSYVSPISLDWTVKNGYLSALISLSYMKGNAGEPLTVMYDYRSAVFDLRTGDKLSFTDLFFKGSDFLPSLNAEIMKALSEPYSNWSGERYELKTAFRGLEDGKFGFTLDKIIFDATGSYFYENTAVPITYPIESFAPSVVDDMTDIFDESAIGKSHYGIFAYDYRGDVDNSYALFTPNPYMSEELRETINAKITELFDSGEMAELMAANRNASYEDKISADSLDVIISADYYPGYILHIGGFGYTYAECDLYFDPLTLNPIEIDAILLPGFETDSEWRDNNYFSLIETPNPDDLSLDYLSIYSNTKLADDALSVYFKDNDGNQMFAFVPHKYIK